MHATSEGTMQLVSIMNVDVREIRVDRKRSGFLPYWPQAANPGCPFPFYLVDLHLRPWARQWSELTALTSQSVDVFGGQKGRISTFSSRY